MNTLLKIVTNISLVLFFSVAPIQKAIAQDCSAVFFMNKGTILEYTNYTKKGKKDAKYVHQTVSVTEEKNETIATIEITGFNKKDKKEPLNASYKVICKKGVFAIDMLQFFNLNQLSRGNKSPLNLKFKGDLLKFPYQMKPGDQLNDGTITIELNNQDDTFNLGLITSTISDRLVATEETITTPAGTFNCKKVTFDYITKIGFMSVRGSGIEWYYNDAVIIKSEAYNRKGKLIGYRELTKIQ